MEGVVPKGRGEHPLSQARADDFGPYAHDPFGPSANPDAYVPSEASEAARHSLEESLDAGRTAALVGPPGHGKTMLLRLLGAREEGRGARVAYLPFSSLAPSDLYALILDALGADRSAGTSIQSLDAVLIEAGLRGGVTLLLDDAHGLDTSAARSLADLVQRQRGRLRLALAALEGDEALRVFQAFGDAIDVVSFDGTLSEAEARRYVETRLAYGGARPELVTRFDDETLAEIYQLSHGVPRKLNQAAQDVVRRAAPGRLPRLGDLTRKPEPEPEEAPVTLSTLAARVLGEEPRSAARPTPPAPPTAASSRPARSGGGVLVESPPPPPPPPVGSYRMARPGEAETRDPGTAAGHELERPRRSAPPPGSGGARPVQRFAPTLKEELAAGGAAGEAGAPSPGSVAELRAQARRGQTGLDAPPAQPLGGAALSDSLLSGRAAPPAPRSRPARLEPPPAPGFEGPGRMGSLLSREVAVSVVKWMAFGAGVGATVMWLLGSPTPSGTVDAAGSGGLYGLHSAEDINRRARRQPSAPPPEPLLPPRPALVPAPPIAAEQEPFAAATPASRRPLERAPQLEPAPAPRPEPGAGSAYLPGGMISVSINATPWATIEVDGRGLGETPLARVPLSPGLHHFRAMLPDGRVHEQLIEISPERRSISFE